MNSSIRNNTLVKAIKKTKSKTRSELKIKNLKDTNNKVKNFFSKNINLENDIVNNDINKNDKINLNIPITENISVPYKNLLQINNKKSDKSIPNCLKNIHNELDCKKLKNIYFNYILYKYSNKRLFQENQYLKQNNSYYQKEINDLKIKNSELKEKLDNCHAIKNYENIEISNPNIKEVFEKSFDNMMKRDYELNYFDDNKSIKKSNTYNHQISYVNKASYINDNYDNDHYSRNILENNNNRIINKPNSIRPKEKYLTSGYENDCKYNIGKQNTNTGEISCIESNKGWYRNTHISDKIDHYFDN